MRVARDRSRLRPADLLPTAGLAVRARPTRAILCALGIAIGIAAITAVLGITRSSEADLLAQIDRLGTNLLVVINGRSLSGAETELPSPASGMIGRIDGVTEVAPTAELVGLHTGGGSAWRRARPAAAGSGDRPVRARGVPGSRTAARLRRSSQPDLHPGQ